MKIVSARLLSSLVIASAVLVTGCATKFERQVFNSEAAVNVKKITVSQWNDQEEIPTFIINHPAAGFGLIGAALVISDRAGKTKTVTEALDISKTKVTSDFYAKLLPALKDNGYEVSPVTVKRGDKGEAVRELVLKDQGQQASLIIGLDASFVAAGATSDYYPIVILVAELTDNKTKAILYREAYHYGYNNGVKEITHLEANKQCRFTNMEALTANIEITRKCLTDSVDVLVNQIKSDLKK
jgi:hypothetical protein